VTTEVSNSALGFQRVHAAYGPYRALFGVTFDVPKGGVKALLGSNGAGKSTVARVASGLIPVVSGAITVAGTDVTARSTHQIARLGLAHVPEGRGVFADLSVEENLVLLLRQRVGRKRVAECLGRAYDAFPILKERRRQRAGLLSGGQQRLLSLANVLVAPPAVLIADELSLGLAPAVVDAVYDGLREINRAGCALVVVEQQTDRVLDMVTEAMVLEHGEVVYDGDPAGAIAALERVVIARGEHEQLVNTHHVSSANSRANGVVNGHRPGSDLRKEG
jgi:branched-chain amino acid transport system ATP-binding protein